MIQNILQSTRAILLVSILCCTIYPALVFLVGNSLFPSSINGSVVITPQKDGAGETLIGSALIGQYNDKPHYFWPRPSANQYDAMIAKASQLPYMSSGYRETITARYHAIKKAHPEYQGLIPIEMVTTSASGLDPHITPEAAIMQLERVRKARKLEIGILRQLIEEHTEEAQWGVFGTRRVNVFLLNKALDEVDAHGR